MDRRLKRVFVIVLDSMGMGAMADAARSEMKVPIHWGIFHRPWNIFIFQIWHL